MTTNFHLSSLALPGETKTIPNIVVSRLVVEAVVIRCDVSRTHFGTAGTGPTLAREMNQRLDPGGGNSYTGGFAAPDA